MGPFMQGKFKIIWLKSLWIIFNIAMKNIWMNGKPAGWTRLNTQLNTTDSIQIQVLLILIKHETSTEYGFAVSVFIKSSNMNSA